MLSLLDEAMGLITPALTRRAAATYDIPVDAVEKAFAASLPAVLGAVAGKAGDAGFVAELHGMLTHPANAAAPGAAAAGMLQAIAQGAHSPMAEMGESLVEAVFGDTSTGVSAAVGRHSGTGGAGPGLLTAASAMVISFLGGRVRGGGLSAGALATTLMHERASMMKAIPIPIAGLMPGSSVTPASTAGVGGSTSAVGTVTGGSRAIAATPGASRMMPVLLAAAALAALAWFLVRGRAAGAPPAVARMPVQAAPAATPDTTTAPSPALTPAPAPDTTPDTTPVATPVATPTTLALTPLRLPNGAPLMVGNGGIETALVAFLTDSTKRVDKTTWFDFDRLLFEPGSTVMVPGSMDQLRNIAEIMAAFPRVRLKIGGYTDNIGSAAANRALSADRAAAAMAALVQFGVAPARLAAQGFGAAFPVANNATEEGRAKNRRTAVRVTAK